MDMQVIDLAQAQSGMKVTGLVYIQSYSKKISEDRKPLMGVLHHKGKDMNFKIWDARLQSILNNSELTGTIAQINGDVAEYRGKTELTITELGFNHGIADKSLFIKSADIASLSNTFGDFLNKNMSPKALQLLGSIMNTDNTFARFREEWAGSRMHDAQVGGLLNHTMKMLNIAKTLVDNDPRLKEFSDMLYFNIVLHDIGKIFELNQGVYTKNSFVTHRTLGVEITVQHKQKIVEVFDETFYYHILAVQQGHHGEWGDKPTTVWAQLIHYIDKLESAMTGTLDRIETGDVKDKNGLRALWMDGSDLIL